MTVNLRLDDAPLGDYVGRFVVTHYEGSEVADEVKFELDLPKLLTLRQHLDNCLDALRDRQLVDAHRGDCDRCQNTRMVDERRNGQQWMIHCPDCTPQENER